MMQHNWKRTISDGVDMALENVRRDVTPNNGHVAWELLREAIQTASQAYSAPPRTGYPAKSTMPEMPDDVTQWQIMAAYLKGDIDKVATESRPPMPSAEQIQRAEIILDIWHGHVLMRKPRMKRAIYVLASGKRPSRVANAIGLTRHQLNRQKQVAMDEMWAMFP